MELNKTKPNWKRVLILVVAMIAITIIIVGLQQTNPQPQPTQPQQEVQQETHQPTTHNINLRVHRQGFSPNNITVHKGDTVNLDIRSTDGLTHGFSIDSYNIREEIPPLTPVQVSFEADAAGTFTYYTHVNSHAGYSNVRGTLIIQEP